MFNYFRRQLCISNLSASDFRDSQYNRELAEALADDIVNHNVKKTKNKYETTYEVELIVATREDFFKAVQEYSQKIYHRQPLCLEEFIKEKNEH